MLCGHISLDPSLFTNSIGIDFMSFWRIWKRGTPLVLCKPTLESSSGLLGTGSRAETQCDLHSGCSET